MTFEEKLQLAMYNSGGVTFNHDGPAYVCREDDEGEPAVEGHGETCESALDAYLESRKATIMADIEEYERRIERHEKAIASARELLARLS